jgi:FAD/FMN-containing dehydrogenase
MRWASHTGVPIVPQGGNTGLSGGATPDSSGAAIVLSLERMNAIRSLDPAGNTVVAEAGCKLAELQRMADAAGRLFPVSLGSEGSCHIGGIVATNAGGINVVRYGMTRDLVLGLEYVTATGEIVPGPKRLRKDNAGYDLRHLLVGSEGTLAVITAAAFRLMDRPKARASALCGLVEPQAALNLLRIIREVSGDKLISFELMDDGEMSLIREHFPNIAHPLPSRHPWYVFIEIEIGADDFSIEEYLAQALARASDAGAILDAVLAQSETQAKAIWHLRFAVSEANRLAGPSISHDVSVATDDVPALLKALPSAVSKRFPNALVRFVGHLADGNMHVIVFFPRDAFTDHAALETAALQVNETVYEVATAFGGSISAEHGIGRSGSRAFGRFSNPVERQLMQEIKRSFDPAGILNPGIIF